MAWIISKALMDSFENSRCSPEQEAGYSRANCSDGEPSAQSRSNHTPQAYCSPDRMTDYSRLSRFGMTFEPLTDARGEELLMWFLAGSPARTSALPEPGPASTENDPASGQKWHGSFAKYSQDSHSWRTHQRSLLGGWDEFSETWPKWGSMRNGACWERTTPHSVLEIRRYITAADDYGLSLRAPTPTVCGNYNKKGATRNSGDGLETFVKSYPKRVPTPMTRGIDGGSNSRASAKKRWNCSLPVASDGGMLNPVWAEWLMGWPLGHTELKPSATDKYHTLLPWPSGYCGED